VSQPVFGWSATSGGKEKALRKSDFALRPADADGCVKFVPRFRLMNELPS
jgi:hypothetical protein